MLRVALALAATAAASVTSAHDPLGLGLEGFEAPSRALDAYAADARRSYRLGGQSAERGLRAEIAYSEARAGVLRRELADYDRVNRFGTGNALGLSADYARLDLMREQMVARDLREQLLLAQRHRRRERMVIAYDTQRETAAATRRAAVGDGSITIVNH